MAVEGTPSSSCSSLQGGRTAGGGQWASRRLVQARAARRRRVHASTTAGERPPDLFQRQHALRHLVLGFEDHAIAAEQRSRGPWARASCSKARKGAVPLTRRSQWMAAAGSAVCTLTFPRRCGLG